MTEKHKKIGELLVQAGLVTQGQLNDALEKQKSGLMESLGTILVKNGALSEKTLVQTLSVQLNIPLASREAGTLKPAPGQNLSNLIPEEFARKYCVLPLVIELGCLKVAMTDPHDVLLLDNLRRLTGFEIIQAIAMRSELETVINSFYGEGGMLKSAIRSSYTLKDAPVDTCADDRLSLDDLVASAEKEPVVKLTDLLIRQAIMERASDIHIEPFHERVAIRMRIDGVLREIPPPDRSMSLPLVSRLKILSKMDIAEKRLPQDGSFRATIEGRLIDFRVSTIPTIHGEKMVIRILDRSAVSLDLETLGFLPEELALFEKAIRKPHGLILLTGPTGSGKTTTLYAALNRIKGPDKNIITVEDPVEYQLDGVNQIQVKPSIGLTFASGLRSFLRQDPDIMLVGEIRDLETAQICVRAALTGHLVFSTLHTNDAPTAITRLTDIGVEPYFVNSSLILVAAQRLVRRLCERCKAPYEPNPKHLPESMKYQSGPLYRPVGCAECQHSGYRGREGIYEIMMMSEEIEDLVLKRSSMSVIRHAAEKVGMTTLEHCGYRKVLGGITSLEEVARVTLTEE